MPTYKVELSWDRYPDWPQIVLIEDARDAECAELIALGIDGEYREINGKTYCPGFPNSTKVKSEL